MPSLALHRKFDAVTLTALVLAATPSEARDLAKPSSTSG